MNQECLAWLDHSRSSRRRPMDPGLRMLCRRCGCAAIHHARAFRLGPTRRCSYLSAPGQSRQVPVSREPERKRLGRCQQPAADSGFGSGSLLLLLLQPAMRHSKAPAENARDPDLLSLQSSLKWACLRARPRAMDEIPSRRWSLDDAPSLGIEIDVVFVRCSSGSSWNPRNHVRGQ